MKREIDPAAAGGKKKAPACEWSIEAVEFYRGLKEPAVVGIASTGYAIWFSGMLSALGHEADIKL